MARIRTIKPETHSSPSLAQVSIPARWVFIGLFTLADDDGRVRDLPKQILGNLFPLDNDITVEMVVAWLAELEDVGCIRRYSVDGSDFFYLPSWHEHQKISKPTTSRLPEPPELPREAQGNPGKPTQEVGSRKLEVGKFEPDFSEAWALYPRQIEEPKALKAYAARRKAGRSREDLLSATKHYAAAVVGQEPRFIKLGATFYGPDEPFLDFVDGIPEGARPTSANQPSRNMSVAKAVLGGLMTSSPLELGQ